MGIDAGGGGGGGGGGGVRSNVRTAELRDSLPNINKKMCTQLIPAHYILYAIMHG